MDALSAIPARPDMARFGKSRVIFQSARFVVSAMRDGSLIVQAHSAGTGKRFTDPTSVAEWIKAFETRMDDREGDDLCRSLMHSASPVTAALNRS